MLINVERLGGQVFNIGVTIWDAAGNVMAKGKQGDTLRLLIDGRTEITMKVNGSFGKLRQVVEPGERYRARPRRGGYYFEKVDALTGS